MKIKPEEPAAPCTINKYSGMPHLGDIDVKMPGLSIRAHFAGLAMWGQVAHYGAANPESVAKMAVKVADALIEELNRTES